MAVRLDLVSADAIYLTVKVKQKQLDVNGISHFKCTKPLSLSHGALNTCVEKMCHDEWLHIWKYCILRCCGKLLLLYRSERSAAGRCVSITQSRLMPYDTTYCSTNTFWLQYDRDVIDGQSLLCLKIVTDGCAVRKDRRLGSRDVHRVQYWLCVSNCLHILSIMCCAEVKSMRQTQNFPSAYPLEKQLTSARVHYTQSFVWDICAVRLFTLTLVISVDLCAAPYNRRSPRPNAQHNGSYTKDMQIRIADRDAIENVKHTNG